MATLIKPDGSSESVYPKSKRIGFTKEELCTYLDCETLLVLHSRDETLILLDADAIEKNKHINTVATNNYNGYLCGTVMFCSKREI